MPNPNSFDAKDRLAVGGADYTYYRLDRVPGSDRLPYSLKVLLENLLRTEDGSNVTADQIQALAGWNPNAEPSTEIQFSPARVVMQDFTGVPAVVDLATMREAVAELGGDPAKINPLTPAELVIDHSVIADLFGGPDSFAGNVELEYQRNRERYQFLRWGQTAFDEFKVVPPGTGIVHQVNIEYLARVVFGREMVSAVGGAELTAYPDTVVGTDSHTTMVNGLGVVGWGVGGIEAEAAMLGQPVSMLIPRVVGFRLTGELPEAATATDLVLTITEMLRQHGVVGKFVEFYGTGVGAVPLANRATIGNMSPEYGSTIAIFPIDDETISYLRLTGRGEEQLALVEAYAKAQGLWHDPEREAEYSEYLELDISTVVPSLAGPKRPQDRVALTEAKPAFREALNAYVDGDADPSNGTGYDESVAESFPASDAPSRNGGGQEPAPNELLTLRPADAGRPSRPTRVRLAEGAEFELDHGAVAIAAITSCTNTSNPSVMIGAALLAKHAVERGLTRKPWVKTSLAPGSKVVSDYYERAGLTPYLDKLGFNLVGYGCTTCIGNSGPLIPEVSEAVNSADLAAVAVLSGNRNFEGRINPDIKMNYLASPPLVVAYALAGSMDVDLYSEPLGTDPDGNPVFLADIWPSPAEVEEVVGSCIASEMFVADYADVFAGDERWQSLPTPEGDTFTWDPDSTYVRKPPYFDGHAAGAGTGDRHRRRPGAAQAGRLGDHRPHQPGRLHPGRLPRRQVPGRARRRAQGLQLLRLPARQPRGDDPGHLRQHPAAQPDRAWNRGRLHPRLQRRRGRGRPGDHGVRGGDALRRGRHPAGRPGRQGVRLRLVAGLGRQGHRAAGRPGGDRGVLRADPPVQPDRDGRAAVAVPQGRERRDARPDRHRDLRDQRGHRAERRRDPQPGAGPGHPGRRRRAVDVRGHRADRHARRGRVLPARRHHAVRAPVASLGRCRGGRSTLCESAAKSV